jgi:predicted P-loop ATPase
MRELIDCLKKGVVTIDFTKIDTGERRVMPCTLNNSNITIRNIASDSDSIVVWAMDKEDFRDVIVSTINEWYIGYPKA